VGATILMLAPEITFCFHLAVILKLHGECSHLEWQ
jgi:hypothetical protein